MSRALDHLVIAFRDLDAAAERYRRLGFKVGPRNRHPWGTENHIVQFDGAFLELVGLGEGFPPPAPDDPVYPFAGFLAEFLRAREGLAMLVLRSADAEADRRAFPRTSGMGDRRASISRARGSGEGARSRSRFRWPSRAAPPSPHAGFFTCEQRFPENFWDKAAQVHPNGATGVAELAFAHPRAQGRRSASFRRFSKRRRRRLPTACASRSPETERDAARLDLRRVCGRRGSPSRDGASLWID